MALLTVHHLSKKFGSHPAVQNLSLNITPGEIVCLLGPSGCGKTTLLRLIAGLETADEGHIFLNGQNITSLPPHQRGMGFMFQEYALFPHQTVGQNIAFGLKMRGDAPAGQHLRTREMLELVGLPGYENRPIYALSGGEQQRVALARSLALNPAVLLLDEPLGALDRALRERLMVELRTILKQVGVTTLFVTHDQAEAFALADRVVVMNEGQIEQMDSPQRLYQRPLTPFVAHFLGFHNVLPAHINPAGQLETAVGVFHLALHPPTSTFSLLIKPSALTNHSDQPLTGRVVNSSFRGRYSQLWVQCGSHTLLFEVEDSSPFEHGREYTFYLNPQDLLLLPHP